MENPLDDVKFALNEMVFDEGRQQIDTVLPERNLGRTKGILIGAAVIGAGWLAFSLHKKFKKRKNEETDTELETQSDMVH